jgi:hypothetical protein
MVLNYFYQFKFGYFIRRVSVDCFNGGSNIVFIQVERTKKAASNFFETAFVKNLLSLLRLMYQFA